MEPLQRVAADADDDIADQLVDERSPVVDQHEPKRNDGAQHRLRRIAVADFM